MLLKHIYISDNSESDQMTIHITGLSSDTDNSTIWAASQSRISIAIWNSSFNTEMLSNKDNSAHLYKILSYQNQNNWSSFIKEYPWSTIVQL